MSLKKERIAFFHNLPGGGGIRMLTEIIDRYKSQYEIDIYIIGDIKPKKTIGVNTRYIKAKPWNGFLLKNFWILFILPYIHKRIAREINNTHKFAFVTHDYFTKTPYIFKFLKIPNLYLCQEVQREFYEPWNVHAPLLKDKVANIIRIPIKYIDKTNVKYANTIFCNSLYSKNYIERVCKRKCLMVYPGVDVNFFTPSNKNKEKIILCVGGINPIKDQYFLVQSLLPILGEYKIVLVGNGKTQYINKLKKICSSQGCLEIINNVSDSDLRDLYRKSMVTCITSHLEPFGLTSIESQSCGTPVVAVKEGGVVETIIDKKNGYLTERKELVFLNSVKLAIKNNKKLGEFARKNVIKNWSWDITLKSFDSYLKP